MRWISRLASCFFLCAAPVLAAEPPEADPAVVAKDPDFLIQGEYAAAESEKAKKALQVIALGDGEFEIVVYEGGLPGLGWNGVEPRRLEGDEDTVLDLVDSMQLKKLERKSLTLGAKPPAGAVVLFDGTKKSLANWSNGKLSETGLLMQGTTSKPTFTDYRLHLEFRTPWSPKKRGQGRGNSGVYQQGRFETQVLDSFGLKGKMNETGGIYSIKDPDLNMCLPPMSWQTYDVEFTAARYDGNKKVKSARMTVRLNGVVVQNDIELTHSTTASPLKEGPEPGPIYLQDHGNPVRYRNIWVTPLDAAKEAARPIVPGFERFFASGEEVSADGGHVLISSLACGACHAGERDWLPTKRGPDLTAVKSRVRADALLAMIRDPHQTKTGTTMPDPWVGLDDESRQKNAGDIASYLILEGKGDFVDRPTSRKVADNGRRLYHETGCVACHRPMDLSKTPLATTVPLGDVARKYSTVALAEFLQNPHTIRKGSRMPGVHGGAADAFAIASYLTRSVTERKSQSQFRRTVYRGSWNKLPDFSQLEPVSQDSVNGLKFNDLRPTVNYGCVYEASIQIQKSGQYKIYLSSDDGSRIVIGDNTLTNDGIHPRTTVQGTFELTAGVHPVRVELFNQGGGAELEVELDDPVFGRVNLIDKVIDPNNPIEDDLLPSRFVADASRVENGKRLFQTVGCVQCHAFGDLSPKNDFSKSLANADSNAGCMAESVSSPALDFKLNATQKRAIVAALDDIRNRTNHAGIAADKKRVHLTMAGLNCYACHKRGDIGGPEPSRNAKFIGTIPEMGLEGRLPPPLTGVADKLNDDYFKAILDKGSNDRPYMKTQMPAFGYESITAFHESLKRLDRKDEMIAADHSDGEKQIVAAGRQAVGNRGLACIKCHRYNGNKGGGIGAIDLLTMPERIRESWFHRYLRDPQSYRPGTRMPNSFVEGRSTLTKLYDGDPARQINAMWKYLKKGTDVKEPEGLKQGAIVLTPTERPLIYRNFFTDVSGRGIAVAYPGDVNLIWDAERMTLAKVWKNSFIDASMHWNGRGQGRQQPMGDDVVVLERETPLAVLDSVNDSWPSDPGRERGYRFRGYRLDKAGNPSFRFEMDGIAVTDTPMPLADSANPDRVGFVRTLTVQADAAPASGQLVWLLGSGRIKQVSDGVFQVDQHTLSLSGAKAQIISVGGKQQLRAVIPTGQTTTVEQTITW